MLLKGSKVMSSKPLLAAGAERGDAVYVLGCRPGSPWVFMDRGVVAAIDPGAWYVTAHADAGWSGGPVLDKLGRLIGLVQDGICRDKKLVRLVTAEAIHWFLEGHKQPGFST
eukprot:GHUV01030051.1.p2 GENE.GHUV01030051.1~~GHUV01030051.1.p2  ORF type:complete len:112 (+),score=21.16 GHUV01030051.1:1-336(+)